MSWSYYKRGRAQEVRIHAAAALKNAEKSCESVPPEAATVRAFATVVDAACKSAHGQCILVEAGGSAWLDEGRLKQFNFNGKIDIIDMD
ncbi:MAG TPA: hypothetical protein VFR24_27205 [Candidatus Angelobacter sp.]|nr:hypothetical protein [Candidatus Angelobacter sp.]